MALKNGIRLFVVVLGLFVLFGTAPLFAGGGAEEEEEAEEITLRIWSRNAEMEMVVNMFNEKMAGEGRNVTAEFEVVPWGQQAQKLMAAMAAGRAPDVFSIGIGRLRYFVEQGGFYDITEWAGELPYIDQFPEHRLAVQGKYLRQGGKRYSVHGPGRPPRHIHCVLHHLFGAGYIPEQNRRFSSSHSCRHLHRRCHCGRRYHSFLH